MVALGILARVDWLTQVTERVWPTDDPALTLQGIGIALLAAVLAVTVPVLWGTLRIGVTLVHELGHALTGLLCGRRFTGFVVRGDMSGETLTAGRDRGLGLVLTTWAGYPAPALFGVAVIVAAVHGWAPIVLTGVLAVLLVTVVRIRSWLTALVLLVTLAATGVLWWWRMDALQTTVLVAVGAFLLMGAWYQCGSVSRTRRPESDPSRLASLTHLPRLVWLATFWIVIASASAAAVWILWNATGLA